MSIGFDEALQPYQEPKRDINDITLLGNKSVVCETYRCLLATSVSLVLCR